MRTLRDPDRRWAGDVFADHLGPHLGEVASDEVAVSLDLQLGDLGPAAFLLDVGELLAVLGAPRVEDATGRRVDRARQVAGEQDAFAPRFLVRVRDGTADIRPWVYGCIGSA